MVRESSDHHGRSMLPPSIVSLYTQGPHWPTVIVGVHREIGHGIMHVPVLGETVGFSNLAAACLPGIDLASETEPSRYVSR